MAVYTANQIQYQPAQIAAGLYQAGVRDPNAIAVLVSIAQRESGGRAGVHRSNSPQGNMTGDFGLFQINYTHFPKLQQAGIIKHPYDLLNPMVNIKAAAYLSGGGNPQAMRQLWGLGKVNGKTTWVGSGGSLPAGNYDAVNQAARTGWAAPSPDGGMGGYGDPNAKYGTNGFGQMPITTTPIAGSFYDILNQQLAGQFATEAAVTQMQSQYAAQVAGLDKQLLGLGQNALNYDRQAIDTELAYQRSLAQINNGLSSTDRKVLKQQLDQLVKTAGTMRTLADQGFANSKDYYNQSNALNDEILKVTRDWLSKQKGFTGTDYKLALQAIADVVATESARWNEVQRATGAEKTIANQMFQTQRDRAWAQFGQTEKEAQLRENMAVREARSDATSRGAMTSAGFGQSLNEFEQQRALDVSGAGITRDFLIRESQNQLNKDLEAITQAYNSGKISYEDAARQAATARGRAKLNYDEAIAQIGFQGQQATLDWKGNRIDNLARFRDAANSYNQRATTLSDQVAQARIGYTGNLAQISAREQQQAAELAMRESMAAIERARLQNTGSRYGLQMQQINAGLTNDQNLLQLQLANSALGMPVYTPDYSSMSPYTGGGGGGGGYSAPRPSSSLNIGRKSSTPLTSSRSTQSSSGFGNRNSGYRSAFN